MDSAQRRKAENEAVFRQVNEQIEALQRPSAVADGEPLHIICECDRLECSVRLTVGVEVYERVRGDPACFFVSAGHEDPAVETVVDSGGSYLIVRKHQGEPQEIAAETDPRS